MAPPSFALITSVTGAMMSTFMFGWTNGNMNTPAPVMRRAIGIAHDDNDPGREALWGWCVSVYCLGAMLGCSQSARAADRLGRKPFILVTTLVFMLGAAVHTLSVVGGAAGYWLTIAGRATVGWASGATTVAIPAYLGEIAPEHLRGSLGVAFQLVVTVSMLCAQLAGMPANLGTPELWPLVAALTAVPGVIQLAMHCLIVESPLWLAEAGHEGEALRAAARLAGKKVEPYAELHDIAVPVSFPEAGAAAENGQGVGAFHSEQPDTGARMIEDRDAQVRVSDLLRDPALRPAFLIAVVTLVTQQLSGINNAFNYSTIYLKENGVSEAAIDSTTVAMNVVNVLATLIAAGAVDRSGRRPLLLGSTAAMAVCTLVITAGMLHIDSEWGVRIAASGIVCFVASFGIGVGPIPWILPSELFGQRHRATAQGAAALSNWLANGVVATAFLPIATYLGALSFLPFGAILTAYTAYAYAALPETRGAEPAEASPQQRAASGKVPPVIDPSPTLDTLGSSMAGSSVFSHSVDGARGLGNRQSSNGSTGTELGQLPEAASLK